MASGSPLRLSFFLNKKKLRRAALAMLSMGLELPDVCSVLDESLT